MNIDRKNLSIWLPEYAISKIIEVFKSNNRPYMRHIMFCLSDHFEPYWRKVDDLTAKKRVQTWVQSYPKMAERHKDSDGKYPQHTFFYPIEEYREDLMNQLAELCSHGYGEVEVHYHHDNDTSEKLRERLLGFKNLLWSQHSLLSRHNKTGKIMYGFIHGNWALDNSRSDGRWCGVNDELLILKESGCYADFTLPSAPSDTQTRKINSIYYATDDPRRPKSHNSGVNVEVDSLRQGDLMIIQGPLCLNFRNRSRLIFPKIENSELSYDNPPTPYRWNLWLSQNIRVIGRNDWIFIKLHTHGAQERNHEILLGDTRHKFLNFIERNYNDGKKYCLHYVTAREMYNIIKAAEEGAFGNPNDYRDYLLVNKGY